MSESPSVCSVAAFLIRKKTEDVYIVVRNIFGVLKKKQPQNFGLPWVTFFYYYSSSYCVFPPVKKYF